MPHSLLELLPWQRCFYQGQRLEAEVKLFAAKFSGEISFDQLVSGSTLLHASFGAKSSEPFLTPFQEFQATFSQPQSLAESRDQYLCASDCPDALLFWVLIHFLPSKKECGFNFRLEILRRLALLLMHRFPKRSDLPYHLLMLEPSGSLLKSAPQVHHRPGVWYSNARSFLNQLQIAWVQGRYEAMWLGSLQSQIDGRHFPLSDHHIRGFSIIGEPDKCLELFKQLYLNNPSEFHLGSISNMFFVALGCQNIPQELISSLVSHFDSLAQKCISVDVPHRSLPQKLEVNERPLMVVVSADLRNHPVGRFWLPIARQLRSQFRLVHVAGHPHDTDPVRSELKKVSDDWWSLEPGDIPAIAGRIRSHSPALMIDLGGHTADNHPVLLSHRLAAVQATYLGFYGPSYARCCDWWIVDNVLERFLSQSYPGSENLWALPGPSLCYIPSLHGLPSVDRINYQEPNHLVFGSFNHTRKLTRASLQRFGEVLKKNPDAVLQFRSHSFHDPSVRRRFLIRLQDMGIAAHQLQPLPYAPSAAAAMSDYGRIHLHFDTFPVSGTTTTLDSLAMGIPVLACPTSYYAGTISAAILEHAGLADHVCSDQASLPEHARWLAERYRSATSRRALAQQVRHSPICDDQTMPRMFVEQCQQMLRQSLSN